MKGPARKPISALEVEYYINGLMARWSQIHGKSALQLLKIAELFTKAEMTGSTEKLKQVAGELDTWCAAHFDDTADWQRIKTYVRVQRHNARAKPKRGATGDLFAGLKPLAQSASDRLTEAVLKKTSSD